MPRFSCRFIARRAIGRAFMPCAALAAGLLSCGCATMPDEVDSHIVLVDAQNMQDVHGSLDAPQVAFAELGPERFVSMSPTAGFTLGAGDSFGHILFANYITLTQTDTDG